MDIEPTRAAIVPPPVPEWWRSREAQLQHLLDTQVKRGQLTTLAMSPGGRRVSCVAYGDAELGCRGTANFNSAMGARRPDAFFQRGRGGRQRHVLVILAGVHGHEVEGMVGASSLIQLLETGRDLRHREQPGLLEALRRLRVLIIPLANPDGRTRVPYDGLVGIEKAEMHRVGQGTRADGTLYGWPSCKAVHPMVGDVGFLGGYFDDHGVNLMHDEWTAPMSATTAALCALARNEGPDLLLNLHSYEGPPTILPTYYVPVPVKRQVRDFAARFAAELAGRGLASNPLHDVDAEGADGLAPPPLGQTSMLYHCGVALPITVEGPHGLIGETVPFGYEQILEVYHTLFEVAAQYLLGSQGNEGGGEPRR